MRKTVVIVPFFLCLGINVFAQSTILLKDLEIPTSPAFILLDQTPTTIERPNSSKAFILSALNSIQDDNGMPKNYAADLTPFWFFKHPTMTSLEYAGYDPVSSEQRIFGNIPRASISFAFITTKDTLTQNTINHLSLGLRSNLITVKSSDDINDLLKANKNLLDTMNKRNDELSKFAPPELRVTNPAIYNIKVKEFYEMVTETEQNSIREILSRKPVFAIDGAIGYSIFFIDNNFSKSHFGRFGAWLTLNYSSHLDGDKSEPNYLNLYVIGRYLTDGTLLSDTTTLNDRKYNVQDFFDLGSKVELEFRKISIAYEFIYRINHISDTFRSSGLIKYKISDQLFLTGAFGKNFGTNNNLISLIGLNWGLSTGSEKAVLQ